MRKHWTLVPSFIFIPLCVTTRKVCIEENSEDETTVKLESLLDPVSEPSYIIEAETAHTDLTGEQWSRVSNLLKCLGPCKDIIDEDRPVYLNHNEHTGSCDALLLSLMNSQMTVSPDPVIRLCSLWHTPSNKPVFTPLDCCISFVPVDKSSNQ